MHFFEVNEDYAHPSPLYVIYIYLYIFNRAWFQKGIITYYRGQTLPMRITLLDDCQSTAQILAYKLAL